MSYITEALHEKPLAISLAQVAKRYKVPRKRVKELARTGVLPTFRLDRRILVLESDLDAFFLARVKKMGICPQCTPDREGVT